MLTPEAELLLRVIGCDAGDDGLRQLMERPGFDWNRLIWLAEREKATSVVWGALRTVDGAAVPPERGRQLARLASISDFRMLHHRDRLAEALEELARNDIEVVLLKGAGLAATVYGSFVQRPMYDLDLLVRADQGRAAWDALRQAGWTHDDAETPGDFYHEHHHFPPLDDPSGTGLAIEIHTAPWAGAVELSAESIWNAARPVEVAGHRAYTLDVNHQILHLAIHFSWAHMLRSAGWRTIRDLRQLVDASPVDWLAVVRLAQDTGGGTCCYWTFALARRLGAVPIPDAVLDALRPPLPAVVLRGLERHFVGGMFDVGCARCPSLRMGRLLWSTAIVHGALRRDTRRPWTRDAEWAVSAARHTPLSLGSRMRQHLAGLPVWARYLQAVLTGRVSAQPPAAR